MNPTRGKGTGKHRPGRGGRGGNGGRGRGAAGSGRGGGGGQGRKEREARGPKSEHRHRDRSDGGGGGGGGGHSNAGRRGPGGKGSSARRAARRAGTSSARAQELGLEPERRVQTREGSDVCLAWASAASSGGARRSKSAWPGYYSWSRARRALQQGALLQGAVRVSAKKHDEAYVSIAGIPSDVAIIGSKNLNRALNGDVVLIELEPQSQWSPLPAGAATATQSETETAGVAVEAAAAAQPMKDNGLWCPVLAPSAQLEEGYVPAAAGSPPTVATAAHDSEPDEAKHDDGDEQHDAGEADGGDCDGASSAQLVRLQAISTTVREQRLQPRGRVVFIVEQKHSTSLIGFLHPRLDQGKGGAGGKSKGARASGGRGSDEGKGEAKGSASAASGAAGGGRGRARALPDSERFVTFKPNDKKYPFLAVPRSALPVRFIDDPSSCLRQMFTVSISGWPDHSNLPHGRVIGCIGEAGEIAAETRALLADHDVDHGPFPEAVLAELERKYGVARAKPADAGVGSGNEPWTIPESEIAKRRDMRAARIFSIDPATAKDLDDALHVKPLPDGTCEIGVHIADVSHFVEPGSALDEEARRRATTVYLVNMVLPMLPPLLCECLCSLNPSVDRLAYSAIWRMNMNGTLVEEKEGSPYPWFGRTVIRSCCKLDYGTAQKMIAGDIDVKVHGNNDAAARDAVPDDLWETDRRPTDGHTMAQVVADVRLLNKIAQARRSARFRNGALALHKVKLTFRFNEKGNPMGVGTYPIRDSNRLVEEYMLLANYLVAQQMLLFTGGRSLIRNHPPPQSRKFGEFLAAMKKNDIAVDGSSAGALSASLRKLHARGEASAAAAAAAVAQAPGQPLAEESRSARAQLTPAVSTPEQQLSAVVELLATEPMCPAQYMAAGNHENAEWRHYALSIPYYTHFTSPIRRYADTMVHRLLTATLEHRQLACSAFYMSKDEVQQVADQCNEKKEASKKAQERSDFVYLCVFLKDHPVEAEATVVSVGQKAFTISVLQYGYDGLVYVDKMGVHGDVEPKLDEDAGVLYLRPGSATAAMEGAWPRANTSVTLFTRLLVRLVARNTVPISVGIEVLDELSQPSKVGARPASARSEVGVVRAGASDPATRQSHSTPPLAPA